MKLTANFKSNYDDYIWGVNLKKNICRLLRSSILREVASIFTASSFHILCTFFIGYIEVFLKSLYENNSLSDPV